VAAMALLLAVLFLSVSCEQHSRGSFLDPTGGPGQAFVSRFSFLQVVGEFNNWNAGIPSMTVDDAGTWRDTLTVQPGCYLMKIRTENDWDESPDFGRCSGGEEDCQTTVPSDGGEAATPVCEVGGEGTALGQYEFLEAGSYEFAYVEPDEELVIHRLTEVGSISGTVAFSTRGGIPVANVSVLDGGSSNVVTQVSSSDTDGTWTAAGLSPGTYDVLIQSPGYVEQLVPDVTVALFETTDIGTVTMEVGCTSVYTALQIVGDFNGFDDEVPSMTEISDCVWADTLTISAGCYYMKFRTNNDWDTPTPDFGRCSGSEGTCQIAVPGDGSALVDTACVATGGGTAIGQVQFPVTGMYEFRFREASGEFTIQSVGGPAPIGSLSGTVAFSDSPGTLPAAKVRVYAAGSAVVTDSTLTSTTDGTWFVANLVAGDYDVQFSATNYITTSVTDVTVVSQMDTAVPLVTLTRNPVGSITGIVAFSDNPSPRPAATIRVYNAGTTVQVGAAASSTVNGSFTVSNLTAGLYDVTVTRTSYVPGGVNGVTVTALMQTNLGTITLQAVCATQMQIVGDFNGWDPAAPFMSPDGACAWADTVAVADGCYRMKLRTNNDWDTSPDWGRCSTASITPCQYVVSSGGTPNILQMCRGVGLKDAFGEVNFQGGGTYEVRFNEQSGLIFLRRIGP
jgi:hypothetical protein